MWLVQDHHGQSSASALTARWTSTWSSARSSTRCRSGAPGSTSGRDSIAVPVVYVRLPDLSVEPATISYSSGRDGIKLHSPVAKTTITVDDDGFILDYPGLAERI